MDDKPPPPYGAVISGQQAPSYPSAPTHMTPYPPGPPFNAPSYEPYETQPYGSSYPPGTASGGSYPMPQPMYPPASHGNEFDPPTHNQSDFARNFSDKSVRHAFIRKVYLILTAQLLVTTAFICVFLLVDSVKHWVQRNSWAYYISYSVFLVTYIALACCPNVRRRYPSNFIALAVFTLAFSYMTATITSFYDTESVMIAVAITAAVCLAISLFAIQTRIDFTKCTALLLVLSLVVFFTGIACMIVYMVSGPNRVLQAVYGGLGALLFGLYLAFDTQMIIGGRKHELSPEEYIYGALQLYLDVVYLFLMILSLFGNKN